MSASDRWLTADTEHAPYQCCAPHTLEIVAEAVAAERQRIRAAVENMPTARIISQWDLVSRRAVVALLDDPS